ncbi:MULTISPECIES: NAD(P)-dependent oxidoreductase [Actinomadura]|uniref:NAD(P)-dependent oxidoreductase n=1 Tax=Actinomadura TaxID=1988 RepID=UPI0004046173|nr:MULTISPECIES: NAD(P)-binding domain-containing protein [Actinomadura]
MDGASIGVTVIGLGEMGAALADAFLERGHPVTVWNRTPGKADALVAKGARHVGTVRDAVLAGELVVVCVKGNGTVLGLLDDAGDALGGRTLLNVTDGTSAEATAVAERVRGEGAEHLHGQIMTIAPGVGHEDAVVFYGGDERVHERLRPVLRALGGRGTWVSADPGAAVLYGMAVHDTMWGLLNGFLHAAALLSDAGIEAKRFLEYARPSMSALTSFLPSIADEVDAGAHAVPFGALRHHLPSVDDVVRESRARGIDGELPEYTRTLVAHALEQGHADDSYSRLVEHFRG